jgi:hypothetical protein
VVFVRRGVAPVALAAIMVSLAACFAGNGYQDAAKPSVRTAVSEVAVAPTTTALTIAALKAGLVDGAAFAADGIAARLPVSDTRWP